MRFTPLQTSRPSPALALAAAGVAVGLCASAMAQVQAPSDGGALDANPRVGAGGNNAGAATPSQYQGAREGSSANNIVTGRVSGGAAFRDAVPYRATTDFRDFTAGASSSRFSGMSAGVTTSGQLINNAGSVHDYYGPSETVAAPSGFARTPGTGGYVPPRVVDRNAARLDTRVDDALVGGATRIDSRVNVNPNDETDATDPLGGGVTRATRLGAPDALLRGDQYDYRRITENADRALSPYTRLRRGEATSLSAEDIRSLREELVRDEQGNRIAPRQLEALISGRSADEQNRERSRDGSDDRDPLRNPVELQGIDRDDRLRLADPAEQSALYAQLQERLNRFEQDPGDESLRPRMRRDAEEARALPGLPALPPELGGEEDDAAPDAEEMAPVDPPVEVQSLATGVSSPTLRRALEEAEQLLREGRYVNAIARYDTAERLVPNQPLVTLGRATAELGAGYYRRSALNLRSAFNRNPELMMARLDLERLLGQERVNEVAANLRERAVENRDDDTSLFLLAFLAYNAGSYEQAGAFLDQATRRSEDPFYEEVARRWALSPEEEEGAPAEDADDEPATRPSGDGESGEEPMNK